MIKTIAIVLALLIVALLIFAATKPDSFRIELPVLGLGGAQGDFDEALHRGGEVGHQNRIP